MKFNTLDLTITDLEKASKRHDSFKSLTYHVKEVFMEFLPKIEINNSSKIVIAFGKQGDEPLFDSMLGVSNVFIENFDFDNFYKLPDKERDITILNVIEDNLITFCEKGNNHESIEAVKKCVNDVIQSNFSISREVKKLSRRFESFTFRIYRVLNREVGESWLCIKYDKKGEVIREEWMTKVPSFLDKTDFFKKSFVEENIFLVKNRFDKIVFKMGSVSN